MSLKHVFSSVGVVRKVPTDAYIFGHGMLTLRCASRSDQAFSELGGDVSGLVKVIAIGNTVYWLARSVGPAPNERCLPGGFTMNDLNHPARNELLYIMYRVD
eukprot:3821259-Pleurochrysis_carterae.AAC.1